VGNTVLVCGSGRSGTTWLAELINHDNAFRFIAEPFEAKPCHMFCARQYLRPKNDDPTYLRAAAEVFTGKVRDARVDSCNHRVLVQKRLVKDVRCNMMLKWVRVHFPEVPIIFIMRHPYSVASSRERLGWRRDLRDVYFGQPELMGDHLEPFAPAIRGARTPLEIHLVDWCVENVVPLRELNPNDVHFVFYEHAQSNPRTELCRLFSYLGRPFNLNAMRNISRPSMSVVGKDKKRSTSRLTAGWTQRIPAEELAVCKRITGFFGLGHIYDDDGMPDIRRLPWATAPH
jgi:hypothetical protein